MCSQVGNGEMRETEIRELVRQQNLPQAKPAGSGGELACPAALPARYSTNQNARLKRYALIGAKYQLVKII